MFNRDKLAFELKQKGWSRYKLSKESGVAQTTLRDIFGEKQVTPSTRTLEKIASALEIPISSFFDDEDIENKNIAEKKIDSRIQPIIDSLDRAGDLNDEDINEISAQVEFLINLKRKKK